MVPTPETPPLSVPWQYGRFKCPSPSDDTRKNENRGLGLDGGRRKKKQHALVRVIEIRDSVVLKRHDARGPKTRVREPTCCDVDDELDNLELGEVLLPPDFDVERRQSEVLHDQSSVSWPIQDVSNQERDLSFSLSLSLSKGVRSFDPLHTPINDGVDAYVIHEDVDEEVNSYGHPLAGGVLLHLDPAQEECRSVVILVKEDDRLVLENQDHSVQELIQLHQIVLKTRHKDWTSDHAPVNGMHSRNISRSPHSRACAACRRNGIPRSTAFRRA
eukprot:2272360-Rhodomonas_salina.6